MTDTEWAILKLVYLLAMALWLINILMRWQ
jgi:hypothetical protein